MKKPRELLTIELDEDDESKRSAPGSGFQPGNSYAFKKGESGNASGRPRNAEKRLISRNLRVRIAARAPDKITSKLGLEPGASWAACISASLVLKASCGDVQASRTILEYIEPVPTRLEFGVAVDQNGDVIPPPSLTVVFNENYAPGYVPPYGALCPSTD